MHNPKPAIPNTEYLNYKHTRVYRYTHLNSQIQIKLEKLIHVCINIFVILLGMESGLCGEVDYSLLVIEIDMLPAPNYQ